MRKYFITFIFAIVFWIDFSICNLIFQSALIHVYSNRHFSKNSPFFHLRQNDNVYGKHAIYSFTALYLVGILTKFISCIFVDKESKQHIVAQLLMQLPNGIYTQILLQNINENEENLDLFISGKSCWWGMFFFFYFFLREQLCQDHA